MTENVSIENQILELRADMIALQMENLELKGEILGLRHLIELLTKGLGSHRTEIEKIVDVLMNHKENLVVITENLDAWGKYWHKHIASANLAKEGS